MTDHNEKLIEEARKYVSDHDAYADNHLLRDLADALEAAEKALGEATVTPTDDAMSHYTDPADPFWQSSPERQGEPSGAQVLAALNAEDNMRAVQGGYKPREKPEPLSAWKAHDIERMRSVVGAALRAANNGA